MPVLGISKGVIGSSQPIEQPLTFYMSMLSDLTTYSTSDSSSVTVTNTNLTLSGSDNINSNAVDHTCEGGTSSTLKLAGTIFSVNSDQDFTLQYWVKKLSGTDGNEYAFIGTGDSGIRNIQCQTISANKLRLLDNNSIYADSSVSNTFVQATGWYFITINRNRSENKIKMYLNGTLYCNLDYTATNILNSDGTLYFFNGTPWRDPYSSLPSRIACIYFNKGQSLDGTAIVNPFDR